jgi:hypothetical protein
MSDLRGLTKAGLKDSITDASDILLSASLDLLHTAATSNRTLLMLSHKHLTTCLSARLPADSVIFYLNLFDADGLMVSIEHEELTTHQRCFPINDA